MTKILAWGALVIGAFCTLMWLITGLSGEDGLDFLNGWMVGPILMLFVVPEMFFFKRMFRGFDDAFKDFYSDEPPKEFVGAPLGMGTVVSVERTGLSINDQPQLDILLDVDTPYGQSFRGVARQIIDVTELAALAPGLILPVRYIPGSTDGRVSIAADAAQAEVQAVFNQIRVAKGEMTARQLHIAEQGIQTQGVILTMAPTGDIEGDRAVIDVTMRVSRPDGSTFDYRQRKPVPSEVIARIQPGMVVQARYLPDDESEVSIAIAVQ